MIGIIGAMRLETDMLKAAVTEKTVRVISGMEFVSGRLEDTPVVIASCGVGKVFAAMCAQTMILEYSPEAVINTGVAGSTKEGLQIGDIVIADRLVQHDMDVCALGCEPGMHMELKQTYFPCAEELAAQVRQSAEMLGFVCKTGTIASGDQFISDGSKKKTISCRFGALACEMEGAAIGQVCWINNTPLVVIRAISDGADDGAKMSFEDFAGESARRSSAVVHSMLKKF